MTLKSEVIYLLYSVFGTHVWPKQVRVDSITDGYFQHLLKKTYERPEELEALLLTLQELFTEYNESLPDLESLEQRLDAIRLERQERQRQQDDGDREEEDVTMCEAMHEFELVQELEELQRRRETMTEMLSHCEKLVLWDQRLVHPNIVIFDIMTRVRGIDYSSGGVVQLARTLEERMMLAEEMLNDTDDGGGATASVAATTSEGSFYPTGIEPGTRIMSCDEYAALVFAPIVSLLTAERVMVPPTEQEEEDEVRYYYQGPHTIVIVFDRPGRTRRSKYTQYEKRYADVIPYVLPTDGSNPFGDGMPLPDSIESVFCNLEAKNLLYEYLFAYFVTHALGQPVSDALDSITDEQHRMLRDYEQQDHTPLLQPVFCEANSHCKVIIDGLLSRPERGRDTPIQVYFDQHQQRVRWEFLEDQVYYHAEAEADLRVWFWRLHLQRLHPHHEACTLVDSKDGDIIMSGLLQTAKTLDLEAASKQKQRQTRARKPTFVRKPYSYGRDPYKGAEREVREQMKLDDPKLRVRMDKSVFQTAYFDLDQTAESILRSRFTLEDGDGGVSKHMYEFLKDCYDKRVERRRNMDHEDDESDDAAVVDYELLQASYCWYKRPSVCKHPIETFVALGYLAGCDYIQSLPYISFNAMWEQFLTDPARYKDLILVQEIDTKTTLIKTEFTAAVAATTTHRKGSDKLNTPYRYGVQHSVLKQLVLDCIQAKMQRVREEISSQQVTNLGEIASLIVTKYTSKPYQGWKDVTEDTLRVMAGNLSFT